MLNKNQSKKRDSWKFCVIIPALIAFVLLFQIEVIAKEKNTINKEVSKEKKSSMEIYKIGKNTTDQELKVIAENLKLNHNIVAVISDLKRNNDGELIAIKLVIKKDSDEAKTIQINGNEAIKDCGIIIATDENGIQKISLVTNGKIEDPKILEGLNTETSNIQNSNINNDAKSNLNTGTDINTNVNTNTSVNANENTVKVTTKINSDPKPIIVINGNFAGPDVNINDIDPNKISSITIIKGVNAVAKYGDIGNNSVIEVVTKVAIGKNEFEPLQGKIVKGTETKKTSSWTVGYGSNGPSNIIKIIKEDKNTDYKKALIIIDGKISDYSELDKLDSNDIKSVSNPVSKIQSEETRKEAMEKYGEKAQNGIIVIETKEYFDKKHNSSK